MRILIVDDDPTTVEHIRAVLAKAGHSDVITASNGAEAMGGARTSHLMLMDVNMPGMGGGTLLKAVREDRRCAGLKVIVVTSDGSFERVQQLMRYNVQGYIVKPFDAGVLLARVNEALGHAEGAGEGAPS